ncbi:unnamed protein product, partial [Tetraodon nigroviridis]
TSANSLFGAILRSVARWRPCVWSETRTPDWEKDSATSCLRYHDRLS